MTDSHRNDSISHAFAFDDPRLHMTVIGRLVVRIVSYAAYLILAVTVFTLLAADVRWMVWAGVFLLLVMVDRAAHRHEADKPLSHMPRHTTTINLSSYLDPGAFSIIERAYDRSAILHGKSVLLEVLAQLSHTSEVKTMLLNLDIPPDEFRTKAEELLADIRSAVPDAERNRFTTIQTLVIRAAEFAIAANHRFIGVLDLFKASHVVRDEYTDRLLGAFSLILQGTKAHSSAPPS